MYTSIYIYIYCRYIYIYDYIIIYIYSTFLLASATDAPLPGPSLGPTVPLHRRSSTSIAHLMFKI